LTIKKNQIPYLRRKIGIIFQDFKLLLDRNVFDNVAFTLRVASTRKHELKRKVLRLLADVGLSHKRDKMPYQLSGGEQQRVAIARALVNEPIVLLADEPTGNLDPESAEDIMQLLEKINSKGTAILMATHDYRWVRHPRSNIHYIIYTIIKAYNNISFLLQLKGNHITLPERNCQFFYLAFFSGKF